MKIIIAKENQLLMQFIPAFLILIYVSYRHTFRNLSHSILGKLFAVMLILYYTRMHFLFGTICCFVVILYYMLTEVKEDEGFESEEVSPPKKALPTTTKKESVESFVVDKPKTTSSIITIDQFNDAKEEFIREKCKNGVLMYKDLPVKTEMSDHVYSEIKFNKSAKCNPCDRTCDYNIVEAKIKTQEALTPKRSRDM
jgi:Ca2+/Na+ antiporter